MKSELAEALRNLENAAESLQRLRDENPIPADDEGMRDRDVSFQANLQMATLAARDAARHTKCVLAEVPA